MNILITNIGRRGYLVKYLRNIVEFNDKIFVSDCDVTASGLYTKNDGHFILSKPVENPQKYIFELMALCKENDISIVIPVIDPEIEILSKFIENFKKEGIFVHVSNSNVLSICYDKNNMNKFLKENGFKIPLTYTSLEDTETALRHNELMFPVILKPVFGSGSVDTYIVENLEKLKSLFKNGMCVQQYLNGTEYGADVFNDLEGNPVRCVIKKKISMRSGETDKSITVKDDTIKNILIKLAKCLGHMGNMDCDIILYNDSCYVIDLNPRFGGGYPATHESGVNLLELVIKLAMGQKIDPIFDNYQDHLLVMKEVSIRKCIIDDYE